MSDPTYASLGEGTGGVWTRKQALEVVTPEALRGLLERGELQRVLPGTYTDGGVEPDHLMWAWAAQQVSGPQATACSRSAARVWGLPLIDDDDPATGRREADQHDVAVLHHRGPRTWTPRGARNGGLLHRSQLDLQPDEVVVHESGLRITTAARTLRDLAAVVAGDALVCAMDHALRTGRVSAEELAQQVERAAGSRQAIGFRWAVEHSDGRAESPGETLARLLLQPHLPGLRPQVPVANQWGEVVARLDLADEGLLLAIEVDGKRGHAGTQMVAKDRERDRRTAVFGWWTERVTWWDLRRRPTYVVNRVLAAAARRRPAAA